MKLSTIKWFVTNPQFIPQAWQIAKRRIFDKPDRYQEKEAIDWCQSVEQPLSAVFDQLGIENPVMDIESLFPDYFQYAQDQARKTPVTMGGPGGLATIYNLVSHFNSQRVVETGVAYGWSSLAIRLAQKNSGGLLVSVDMPYVSMNNESYVGTVVRGDLRDSWTLIRKADRQGIPEALKLFENRLDLVHYDSDKSYSGRLWAYPKLWDALVPGGVLISDDIQDNIGFKHFCDQMGLIPLVHSSDSKYVGILQKPVK